MTEPWKSEYTLDPREVTAIVRQNTDLPARTVVKLGEGWDFFSYLVDGQWVFRFPKRAGEADRLLAERAFLGRLQLPVARPEFTYFVEKPDGFHLPFAGYAFVPGTPLDRIERDSVDAGRLASNLGEALRELHGQSLTPKRPRIDPVAAWMRSFESDLARIRHQLQAEVVEVCARALRAYEPRVPIAPPVTTHNDLGAEHILVDNDGGLAALIDWGDAETADRYVDLVGLWAWGGDGAVSVALESYGAPLELADWARLRTHGLYYAVGQVYYGEEVEDQELVDVARGWIVRLAGDGELDDPYRPPP